jgi:hypoxanthine-DNA glycosylase
MSTVFGLALPRGTDDKKRLLLSHGIALWDVLRACEISGSADATIRNGVPNDIAGFVQGLKIERILCNGATADTLYGRYVKGVNTPVVKMPSTSPANASWSLERLVEAWKDCLWL